MVWRLWWLLLVPVVVAYQAVFGLCKLPAPNEETTHIGSAMAAVQSQPLVAFVITFALVASLLVYWADHLPGGAALRDPAKSDEPWSLRSRILSAFAIAAACLAALGLRAAGQMVAVSGMSMFPTLNHGDVVWASRWGDRLPERGEAVLIKSPMTGGPGHLVKRVIGLPGDEISMRHGHPIINGWEVPSCFLGSQDYREGEQFFATRLFVEFLGEHRYLVIYTPFYKSFDFSYRVQDGEVFILGDNRNNSSDSRALGEGKGKGVSNESLRGRVTYTLWPRDIDGTLAMRRILRSTAIPGLGLSFDEEERSRLETCLADPPQVTNPPVVQ
jgi:signal peptidase I